jgi:hypothetical protein
MLDLLAQYLPGAGAFGLVLLVGYRLHSDAVKAERGRADDARSRAEAAEKRAEVREQQIAILLGKPKEP